jgi:hypothetical protein
LKVSPTLMLTLLLRMAFRIRYAKSNLYFYQIILYISQFILYEEILYNKDEEKGMLWWLEEMLMLTIFVIRSLWFSGSVRNSTWEMFYL